MTGTNVADAVRVLTQDTAVLDADRRWTASELLAWTNEGVGEIKKFRPDCIFNVDTGDEIAQSPSSLSALTETLWLPDKWKKALTDYVCHRCYMRDSEDAGNRALASEFWNAFTGDISS